MEVEKKKREKLVVEKETTKDMMTPWNKKDDQECSKDMSKK
jgi:hypothetical protein